MTLQTQEQANAYWADKEVKKWAVKFTKGPRGRRLVKEVTVSAASSAGARRAALLQLEVLGHEWARSAASTVRLATAQDLGAVDVLSHVHMGGAVPAGLLGISPLPAWVDHMLADDAAGLVGSVPVVVPTDAEIDMVLERLDPGWWDVPQGATVALAHAVIAEWGGLNVGIEIAACWVEKRMADYQAEHGRVDLDTGTVEYGRGDAGNEYVGELVEIAEGLRALKGGAA